MLYLQVAWHATMMVSMQKEHDCAKKSFFCKIPFDWPNYFHTVPITPFLDCKPTASATRKCNKNYSNEIAKCLWNIYCIF